MKIYIGKQYHRASNPHSFWYNYNSTAVFIAGCNCIVYAFCVDAYAICNCTKIDNIKTVFFKRYRFYNRQFTLLCIGKTKSSATKKQKQIILHLEHILFLQFYLYMCVLMGIFECLFTQSFPMNH